MSTVAELEKEIAERERQIERLRDEIQTLREAKNVLSGPDESTEKSRVRHLVRPKFVAKQPRSVERQGTIASMAAEVIRSAGKPLPIGEIVQAVKQKGNSSEDVTIQNVIYRDARIGRVFKLVNPGVFGLLGQ